MNDFSKRRQSVKLNTDKIKEEKKKEMLLIKKYDIFLVLYISNK